MTRPAISELPCRKPKALHRTLPMWVREVSESGVVWRVYAPVRGAAVFMSIFGTSAKTRAQIAAELRAARRVIWGRTKIVPQEIESPAKAKKARTKGDALTAEVTAQHEEGGLADTLEAADVESTPLESADDDLPPWSNDVDSGNVHAEPAAQPLDDDRSKVAITLTEAISSPPSPRPGQVSHEQGSLF